MFVQWVLAVLFLSSRARESFLLPIVGNSAQAGMTEHQSSFLPYFSQIHDAPSCDYSSVGLALIFPSSLLLDLSLSSLTPVFKLLYCHCYEAASDSFPMIIGLSCLLSQWLMTPLYYSLSLVLPLEWTWFKCNSNQLLILAWSSVLRRSLLTKGAETD